MGTTSIYPGGGTSTVDGLTDATAAGKAIVKAADAAAQLALIGAQESGSWAPDVRYRTDTGWPARPATSKRVPWDATALEADDPGTAADLLTAPAPPAGWLSGDKVTLHPDHPYYATLA